MPAPKKSGKTKPLDAQALRAFRSSVAALKKKGIVSPRVDARSQAPTKYMRAKVRKFNDVLEGRAIAVKAPKQIREQYTSKGLLEERGAFLITGKEFSNQRARLRRGLVQVVRPLKNGTEEYLILPWKANDLIDLIDKLKDDPEALDSQKMAGEYLSFRLFGHNSSEVFGDTTELADALKEYVSRLGKRDDVVKHITLQRYRGALRETDRGNFVNPLRGTEPLVPYNSNKPKDKNRPKDFVELQRDKRRAAKRRKYIARLTPAENTVRLETKKMAERARRAKLSKLKGK